jgi:hypothetical protein
VQFDQRHRDEILAGDVTLTFRRWRRRQAVAGNTYRTSLGRIRVESVDIVDPDDITTADARRAGATSPGELIAKLTGDPGLPLYRVAFRVVDDPDPRQLLAGTDDLDASDLAEIDRRLDRLDRASSYGPWTRPTLQLIGERPGTRAADLAASVGRETQPFKADVRKLKNLGLTISLDVGYELSARGRAYLGHRRPDGNDAR